MKQYNVNPLKAYRISKTIKNLSRSSIPIDNQIITEDFVGAWLGMNCVIHVEVSTTVGNAKASTLPKDLKGLRIHFVNANLV
jgi:hypothetical protein